jgi:hypothetical protein
MVQAIATGLSGKPLGRQQKNAAPKAQNVQSAEQLIELMSGQGIKGGVIKKNG